MVEILKKYDTLQEIVGTFMIVTPRLILFGV